MRNVITMVLGGGRGTRLYPLTKYRSKPAVPLAGKYRLIDIPLSNCINSGLNRIYVLTQFNSVSLHRHIRRAYAFDQFSAGFVEILAAQQTNDTANWYQGTADAVRQNLRYVDDPAFRHVLILSGDQLYRMNFKEMMESHRASQADVTIAAMPVDRQTARSMGLMRVDDAGRVGGFLEKPQTDREIDLVRMDPAWIDERGIPSAGRDCLASMGIYLFNREALVKLLTKTDYHDFGREIFPAAARTHRVQVHLFDGYWEDIGTIRSFYDANLALAAPERPFDLASATAPIYSRARFLPPSRIDGATIRNSLVADGCAIEEGAVIENSVIGLRCAHRPRRDDPQLDPDGCRRVRKRRRRGRGRHGRSAADGHRRRQPHRGRHHRQELPHRPQGARRQRARPGIQRRDARSHDPRRHRLRAKVRDPARRLADVSGSVGPAHLFFPVSCVKTSKPTSITAPDP